MGRHSDALLARAVNVALAPKYSQKIARSFRGGSRFLATLEAAYLDTAFGAIETGAGSVDAYFETVLGVTPSVRDAIMTRLLVPSRLCWNLFGAVSGRVRISDQAARSIDLSASFWVRVCHPSTLRMVI
jgi:Tyrosine phosphatase family